MGTIYTTIMELGLKRPSLLWFWGPNSIMAVYMDPLGSISHSGMGWFVDQTSGYFKLYSEYIPHGGMVMNPPVGLAVMVVARIDL